MGRTGNRELWNSRAAALLHPLRPLSGTTAAVEENKPSPVSRQGSGTLPFPAAFHCSQTLPCQDGAQPNPKSGIRGGADTGQGKELPCRSLILNTGAQAAAPAGLMAPGPSHSTSPVDTAKSQSICSVGPLTGDVTTTKVPPHCKWPNSPSVCTRKHRLS